jgi:GT2 family glycosyltransferase
MSAYALNIENTRKLHNSTNTRDFFLSLPQKRYGGEKKGGWLNHNKYRQSYFHFCSAITKENLNLLDGFDEKYAMGIGYDDNDFLIRVRKLGLKVEIVDNVSVIHQWHPIVYQDKDLAAKNKKIFKATDYANTKQVYNYSTSL